MSQIIKIIAAKNVRYSLNGINESEFEPGELYQVPDHVAAGMVKRGWAEPAKLAGGDPKEKPGEGDDDSDKDGNGKPTPQPEPPPAPVREPDKDQPESDKPKDSRSARRR